MLDLNKLYPLLSKKVSENINSLSSKESYLKNILDLKLFNIVDIQNTNTDYTVASIDGSQIYLDRHFGVPFFLINTGTCIIKYKNSKAELFNNPRIFCESDFNIFVTDNIIDGLRFNFELEDAINLRSILPKETLFVFDGSIFPSSLEEDIILNIYLENIKNLKNIKSCFFISKPRSRDIAKKLNLNIEFNGSKIYDLDIFDLILQNGQRSEIFESTTITGSVKFKYFYIKFYEIFRVEFLEELLDIPELIYDQILKGMGYPVCLSEAHEQAVIKNKEREIFINLIFELSKSTMFSRSSKNMSKSSPHVCGPKV